MKKKLSLVVLAVFFFQIAYLSYHLPQIILLGEAFSADIKLAAVVAGLCLGVMLMLKEYRSPLDHDQNRAREEPEDEDAPG